METTPLLSPFLYRAYHAPPHLLKLPKGSELDFHDLASPKLPKSADTTLWPPPEGNFQIDDLLDFSDEEEVASPSCDDVGHSVEAHISPHAPNHNNFAEKLQEEEEEASQEPSSGLCIPPDELADQLEWLSAFNEDNSYAGDTKLTSLASSWGLSGCKETPKNAHKARDKFHSPSPVSVLEQGGHVYANSYAVIHVPRPKRLRKARTGGRVWSLDILKPTLVENRRKEANENTSLLITRSSDSEPYCTFLQQDGSVRPCKKLKKAGSNCCTTADPSLTRRCSHCLVQKTPQWRAGPMGPKTLCNACGVRYKSGRLVPEYRPAGSPSFVSEVHSNSHRRILEMRHAKEMEAQVDKLERLEETYDEEDCHSRSETCKVHPICDENLEELTCCKEMPLYGERSSCYAVAICGEGLLCEEDPSGQKVPIGGGHRLCEVDAIREEVPMHEDGIILREEEDPVREEAPICEEEPVCHEKPTCGKNPIVGKAREGNHEQENITTLLIMGDHKECKATIALSTNEQKEDGEAVGKM